MDPRQSLRWLLRARASWRWVVLIDLVGLALAPFYGAALGLMQCRNVFDLIDALAGDGHRPWPPRRLARIEKVRGATPSRPPASPA